MEKHGRYYHAIILPIPCLKQIKEDEHHPIQTTTTCFLIVLYLNSLLFDSIEMSCSDKMSVLRYKNYTVNQTCFQVKRITLYNSLVHTYSLVRHLSNKSCHYKQLANVDKFLMMIKE